MKKITVILLVLFAGFSSMAQVNVKLRINHKMSGAAFSLNTENVNNLGNKFNFNRVRYYLSDIRIVHDGGVVTTAKDTYLFVDAAKPMDFELGSYSITKIEHVYFSVGVDKARNHLDHTLYPNWHPLGPKDPTMHWGWTTGYRFIAMDGKSGFNLNKNWEIHSMFDDYYYSVYLPATTVTENTDQVIVVNADYTKALSSIDMTEGLLAHGSRKQDLVVLKNFRDSVFSNTEGVLDIRELDFQLNAAYPNPSLDGTIYFDEALLKDVKQLIITNSLGAEVKGFELGSQYELNLTESGIYFIRYVTEDNRVYNQKIIVSI